MKAIIIARILGLTSAINSALKIGVREIFCQGGGGGGGSKPFAQKNLASCPNFYERVEKKLGPYATNKGRPGI